jgi:hypothetical protein
MRKGSKTTRRHKGGFYGAAGPIAPGVGAMQWNRGSEFGDWSTSSRGANAQYGSARRRKTKRHGKKKKTKRGGGYYGAAYGSFEGTGNNGLVNLKAGSHPGGEPRFGHFNNKGAGPGDFSSFK